MTRVFSPPSAQGFKPCVFFCLSYPGDPGGKKTRRVQAAQKCRILLLIEDNWGDFVALPPEQATREGRQRFAESYSRLWGERWFVFANPRDGSWERTVGSDLHKKWEALRLQFP